MEILFGEWKPKGDRAFRARQNDWRLKWYRENGELMQTGSFDADEQKTGKWTRYQENGKKYDEGEFVAGKKVGEWHVYDKTGKIS